MNTKPETSTWPWRFKQQSPSAELCAILVPPAVEGKIGRSRRKTGLNVGESLRQNPIVYHPRGCPHPPQGQGPGQRPFHLGHRSWVLEQPLPLLREELVPWPPGGDGTIHSSFIVPLGRTKPGNSLGRNGPPRWLSPHGKPKACVFKERKASHEDKWSQEKQSSKVLMWVKQNIQGFKTQTESQVSV